MTNQNLLTGLLFTVTTAFFVFRHMRASVGARGQGAARALEAPCPRCGYKVPRAATFCPKCGVPQQVYEVVSAAEVTADTAAAGDGGAAHAVVRADLCVGCGACVPVCPEPGAIKLAGKLAVVEKSLCKGHGKCVEACPVGGIVITTGAAVHRVEVPLVGISFESNVPGIYIVGELGGRGLIKNAINEGKIAVENIAMDLPPGVPRQDGVAEAYDVVVVGSGPAGISAGLEALRNKLRYVVLEQGTLADTIRKYPRAKFLLAEPLRVPLYGELWVADASKESLLQVWESIISSTGLDVRTNHRVTGITRDGKLLQIETSAGQFLARRVVLAMGRRGNPRRLGVPGEQLGKVIYDVVDMESFAGQKLVVVGGGDSAIESALGLARQPGAEVTLSYRGDDFKRVKDRNRSKLDEAVRQKLLRVALHSELREIREREVVLDVEGRQEIVPNDTVVVRIGGDPPFKFLEQLGIRIVKKDVPLPESEEAVVA